MTPAQIAQPAMLNALKTHCHRGHEFSGDNLRIKVQRGRETRVCVTCKRAEDQARRRALVIAANPNGPDPALALDDVLPIDVWKRIAVNAEGCWIWTGSLNRAGYGRTTHGDGSTRYTLTHRLTYTRLVGPISDGLELDHLCRVRACCNPAHLEPVTHRENMLRGETFAAVNATKTHCPAGHPYSGSNLGISRGQRWCRECNNNKRRARRVEIGSLA